MSGSGLLLAVAFIIGQSAMAAPTYNDWQRELTVVCPSGSTLGEAGGSNFECMNEMQSLNPRIVFSPPPGNDGSVYRITYERDGKEISVPAELQRAFDTVALKLNPEGYAKFQKKAATAKVAATKRKEKSKELAASFDEVPLSCPASSGAKPKLYSNIKDPWYEGGCRRVCVKDVGGNEVYHGPNIIWRADGSKAIESNYKDGQLDGKLTMYGDKGKKERESYFKGGAQHGETTTWLPNGDFKTTTFQFGKPHGREWGTIDHISFEAQYERGIQVHREVKRAPASK